MKTNNSCTRFRQKAQKVLTPDVLYLLRLFQGQLRLVGGVVRDCCLSRKINDYDMATPLAPQDVIALLQKNHIPYALTGLKHGTVTAIFNHIPYEITTLRKDEKTNGRHAEVRYIQDYAQDALRRDLTINALYMDENGVVYDYFGGLSDLKKGVVRFIGNPDKRVQEDYLRILRLFRFYAKYGKGDLDEASYQAVVQHKEGLKKIAKERLQEELLRLLSVKNPIMSLKKMQAGGVFEVLGIQVFIEDLEGFLRCYPQSNALERLHILTRQAPIEKALFIPSKMQKKYWALYQEKIDFSSEKEVLFALWRLERRVFLFHLYQALAQGQITGETFEKYKKFHKPVFPLKGKDMLLLGYQGAQIKEAMALAQEIWKEKGFLSKKSLVIKELLLYNLKR